MIFNDNLFKGKYREKMWACAGYIVVERDAVCIADVVHGGVRGEKKKRNKC